jgi:hypothetical protein
MYPGPGVPGGPDVGAPKKGLALTSMILGIVAVVLCLVPIINTLAFVIALAAAVVGIIALVQIGKGKQQGKGMGIAGIIMAVVAIIGVIVSQLFYVKVLDDVSDAIDDAQTQIEQEAEQPADDPVEDTTADDATGDPAAEVPATDEMTIGFDEVFLYEDGLQITVGAPTPYAPDEYAAGLEGGPNYVVMNVTIVNGTTENFDPVLFYATASSAGTEATEIYDTALMDARPSTAVLPGASVSFPMAFAVADPAQLVVEVEPTVWLYESLVVTNG